MTSPETAGTDPHDDEAREGLPTTSGVAPRELAALVLTVLGASVSVAAVAELHTGAAAALLAGCFLLLLGILLGLGS